MRNQLIVAALLLITSSFQLYGQSCGNLAFGKKATQSSNHNSTLGLAELAVDGNTDGRWVSKSVTHTQRQENSWWEVDLGKSFTILKIEIWNRTDCCSERLSNYDIFVKRNANDEGEKFNGSAITYKDGEKSFKVITGFRNGRFIRIRKNGRGYLSLAEVKVYGTNEQRAAWVGKKEVTYTVSPMADQDIVDNAAIYASIQRSFNRWGDVMGVTFERVNANGDIKLGFYEKSNSPFEDGFDGSGWERFDTENELGRAQVGGDIIAFDKDDFWITDQLSSQAQTDLANLAGFFTRAVNLDAVATHEIGHAMGLEHSSNPDDVMFRYNSNDAALSESDKMRARMLFNNQGGWNCPSFWGGLDDEHVHTESLSGIRSIESVAFPGMFLRMDASGVPSSGGSGGGTVNVQNRIGSLESLKITRISGGLYTIALAGNPNRYLRMEKGGKVNIQNRVGGLEKFRIREVSNGMFSIESAANPGHYLRISAANVPVSGGSGGGTVNVQTRVGSYEKFRIVREK